MFAFHLDLYIGRTQPGAELSFGSAVHRLASGMNTGVWVFFVLSGYLLGKPFLAPYLQGTAPPDGGAFLRNRVRRLVPAMWLLILVTTAVEGLQGEQWWRVIQAMLFAQVYDTSAFSEQVSHLWTLDAEMLFYVGPVVASLAIGRATSGSSAPTRLRIALGLTIAVGAVSLVLRATLAHTTAAAQLPPMVMVGFVPGLLLAIFEDQLRHALRARSTGLVCGSGFALGVAVVGAGAVLGSAPLVVRSVAAVVGSGLVLAATLCWEWSGRPAVRLLDNPVLQSLGQRSYSFYLWHLLVLHELALHLAPHLSGKSFVGGTAALGLVMTLIITEGSYRFAERPYRSRHERWRG